MIEKFKHTQDYIDICYMIDHIKNIDIRISVLKELGYTIGLLISKENITVKNIIIDKQKNLRIQVTPKYRGLNMAHCVIIKKNAIK